jgi:hypothetical protein
MSNQRSVKAASGRKAEALGVTIMSAVDRQKQRERFLLERFIEAAGFRAEITEERESPDFIVRFYGRAIGVEITELFISHDAGRTLPQAQESISTKIVSRAEQMYQASGASPAHVTVCFGSGCDLSSLNRDQTASALAFFIQRLGLSEWQRVDWRPERLDGPLPHEISFVHALGVPSFQMAHWSVARAGWVASVEIDALQLRIENKAVRLQEYTEAVVENWLIVVADSTKPSQMFEVKPDFDPRKISSPFSRTFFYRYPGKAVIELGGATQ